MCLDRLPAEREPDAVTGARLGVGLVDPGPRREDAFAIFKLDPAAAVFLSATQERQDRVRAFRSGGVDFVAKSVHIEEVAVRVETHLDLKHRTAALGRVNEQLRSVEESRRRFITSMVHDIKNPLTPVLKNTEWLLGQQLGDEETEVVRDTHVAANHLHRMVLSLLDLARSTELELQPQREQVSLRPWLEGALSLTRLQLRSCPERIVVECDEATGHFDPTLMARVLQNTIDNALKYSPRSEQVQVRVSRRKNNWEQATLVALRN